MNWNQFKSRLKEQWLLMQKRSMGYFHHRVMLRARYERQWEEYPWTVFESLQFTCISGMADTYQVEKLIVKKHLLPTGEIKTQVEQKTQWHANIPQAYFMAELGSKGRQLAFLPERNLVLYEGNEYKLQII